MVFDITQLKKIRRQLNLTQHQFAKQAGVSQSMIAKIESGKLDPTYSYVKKIEALISSKMNIEEIEARGVMNRNVKTAMKGSKLKKVVVLFTKYGISQVPILYKRKVIGLITETNCIEQIGKNMEEKLVEEVMGESPPIISGNAKISVVISLLRFYPIVLVMGDGKLEGIITKADVLKKLK